jgi:methionine-rich copper-binding protein CopC
MRLAQLLGGGLLMGWAACVQAHAHLEESLPADNSVTRTAPTALVLRFSEAARLTALSITQEGGARQKLNPPQGSRAKIEVALPALAPGHYLVSWRVLGADGHVLPGQIRFTLTR